MDRVIAMSVSPSSSVVSAPCINTPSLTLLRSRHTQCVCVGRRSMVAMAAPADAQDTEAGSTGGAAIAEESASPPPIDSEILLSSALATPRASLINYANIQKALNGEALLTPDHYATLGVARFASYEEVEIAFRKRCQDVLQQGKNEEEMRNMLKALKFSYDILSLEEERRLYDWSLGQSQSPGGIYVWPYEEDITQDEDMELLPEGPGDEEGLRRVTYIFVGWFILSVVLNIALPLIKP